MISGISTGYGYELKYFCYFSSFEPVLFYSTNSAHAPALCLSPHTLIVFSSYYAAFYVVNGIFGLQIMQSKR